MCCKILQKMSRKWKKTLAAKFTKEITFRTFSDLLLQHVGSVVVCINSNLPSNRNCEAERGPAFFFFFLMRGGTFFKQKPISGKTAVAQCFDTDPINSNDCFNLAPLYFVNTWIHSFILTSNLKKSLAFCDLIPDLCCQDS